MFVLLYVIIVLQLSDYIWCDVKTLLFCLEVYLGV